MDFKKIKHIRSSATGYRAKLFYDTDKTKLFFESPYRDDYDDYQEESDFVPDKIVDRFGRRVLSLS